MTSPAPRGIDDLPPLPATSWAVLGLLTFGDEVSGYDIKKWADWSLRDYYWSPSFSQVYSELKRLEQQGYATSRMQTGEGIRTRRMYRITDAGRAAITIWEKESAVETPFLKHGVLLRVAFGHLGDPETLKSMLREHVALAEQNYQRVRMEGVVVEAEPAWAYARLAIRWSEWYYASERELALRLIDEIDAAEVALKESGHNGPTPIRMPDAGRWRWHESISESSCGTDDHGDS